MKKIILFMTLLLGVSTTVEANEKWSDWTNEYRAIYIQSCTSNAPYNMCECFQKKVEHKYPSVIDYKNAVDTGEYKKFIDSGVYSICVKEINDKHSDSTIQDKITSAPNTAAQKKKSIVGNQKIIRKTTVYPSCTYFTVSNSIKQLNIRNTAGKQGKVIDRVNRGDSVCIYEFSGKWGRIGSGWLSRKYLDKDYVKNNFLLADVNNNGKKDHLVWEVFSNEDYATYYQLKLYSDNKTLLWSGPKNTKGDELVPVIYDGEYMPVALNDIDNDGNLELIIGGQPHEAVSPSFTIFKWHNKTFKKVTTLDLVWMDPPRGTTLKWVVITDKDYSTKQKIYWCHSLEQLSNEEFPVINILGVSYPNHYSIFDKKAKIKFIEGGAKIIEWVQ